MAIHGMSTSFITTAAFGVRDFRRHCFASAFLITFGVTGRSFANGDRSRLVAAFIAKDVFGGRGVRLIIAVTTALSFACIRGGFSRAVRPIPGHGVITYITVSNGSIRAGTALTPYISITSCLLRISKDGGVAVLVCGRSRGEGKSSAMATSMAACVSATRGGFAAPAEIGLAVIIVTLGRHISAPRTATVTFITRDGHGGSSPTWAFVRRAISVSRLNGLRGEESTRIGYRLQVKSHRESRIKRSEVLLAGFYAALSFHGVRAIGESAEGTFLTAV